MVVTGVSSGLGRAAARRLARVGYRVVGTVRSAEDAARVAVDGVEPLELDVTDEASTGRLADVLEADWPGVPLAGLVNNAGVGLVGPLAELGTDELRHVFEVNVFGVHRVTRALLPRLLAARGRIVNVSSVVGRVSLPFIAGYAASKHALEALSDGWRRELAPFGVRVIVIQPEAIRSRIWDKTRRQAEGRFEGTPWTPWLRRFGRASAAAERAAAGPEVVADAVERAICAPEPPLRILVAPRTAPLQQLMRLMPDGLLDRVIARKIDPGRDG